MPKTWSALCCWSADDNAIALAENWLLSRRSDGYWEIQRYDEGDSMWSDWEAFVYCKQRAHEGSELHRKALELHGTKSLEK